MEGRIQIARVNKWMTRRIDSVFRKVTSLSQSLYQYLSHTNLHGVVVVWINVNPGVKREVMC